MMKNWRFPGSSGRRGKEPLAAASGAEDIWLVAGLGNPGSRYARNWHNLGFICLEILSQKRGFRMDRLRFKSLCSLQRFADKRVLFMQPQTYMNLSGESLREAARFYKVPPERVVLVLDDVDLPLGTLRIRERGSAGTHNGLRSAVYCLNSDQFIRLRIGIGPKPEHLQMADYVLQNIPEQQNKAVYELLERAASALELILEEGAQTAMCRYNG